MIRNAFLDRSVIATEPRQAGNPGNPDRSLAESPAIFASLAIRFIVLASASDTSHGLLPMKKADPPEEE
jgi:hypothetical protein